MQRLFGQIKNNFAYISKNDEHHILNVKRFKVGEKLEIRDNDKTYLCNISSINPLEISVINEIKINREIGKEIVIGFALLKGDHNSLIVEKCTEIGVTKFVPFVSARSVIKAEVGNDNNRIDRLSKIIKGASEQSRRDVLPEIKMTSSFKEALKIDSAAKLIAYEGIAGSSTTLLSYLSENKNIDSVYILIGPEGGFTENEVKDALAEGFIPVSLGRTILRGETACIASAAIISSFLGENNG